MVGAVSVHMYVPVVSRSGPEGPAGQPSTQAALRGAVGEEDGTPHEHSTTFLRPSFSDGVFVCVRLGAS